METRKILDRLYSGIKDLDIEDFKSNLLPAEGIAAGSSLQAMEEFTGADPIQEISSISADKPLHFWFSYGCAHYVIEGFNLVGMEEQNSLKHGTAIMATAVFGGYLKEKYMDPQPDPSDMVANMAGATVAIYEDHMNSDYSSSVYSRGEQISMAIRNPSNEKSYLKENDD